MFAGAVRVGVVDVLLWDFVLFGGVIVVVVFLGMLAGVLRSERRARKNRQQQSCCEKLPHATYPSTISIAGHRTTVTLVPRVQPGDCSDAAG